MRPERVEQELRDDSNDVDPAAETLTFDNMYKIDDAVPENVRKELMEPGYGPPVRGGAAGAIAWCTL